MKYKFSQIVSEKDGFLRGPFGSALKKSLFVPKGEDTYKVYEQCVPLEQNQNLGKYYISKEYFDNSLSKFSVKPGDFLISCSGVNYGAIIELKSPVEQGVINQALLRVRLNSNIIDSNYFLYLFKGLIYKKITSGTGDSTIPNFPSMDFVKNIEFDLPDLSTQRRIGKILSNIDSKIVVNNLINDNLQQLAEKYFDYWFLQYEFPSSNNNPYKSNNNMFSYNDLLKTHIPQGWEIINIRKLCDLIWGQCPNGENILPLNTRETEAMLYCSGAGDMRNGIVVDPQAKTNCSRREAQPNDILMSVAGSIGALCICDKTISLGRAAVAFRPKTKHIAYCYFIIKKFINRMLSVSSGSIQKVVNDSHIDDMNFPYNEEIVSKFDFANQIIQKCIKLVQENNELINLRNELLPLLMNGQVSII